MMPFRRFLRLLSARDRWSIALVFVLVVVGAVLETGGVALLPLFVAELSNPTFVTAKLALYFHAPEIIDWNPQHMLFGITAVTGLYFIAKNLFGIWLTYRQSALKTRLIGVLGRRLLSGYLRAPYTWHLTHSTSVMQGTIQHDVIGLFQRMVNPLIMLGAEAVVVVLVLCLLFFVSPLATLVILALVSVTFLAYLRFFRGSLQRSGQQLVERRTGMYRCLQNSLGGIKELKVLGRLGFFEQQFGGLIDDVARAEEYNTTVGYNVKPVMETLAVTILCLLVTLLMFVNHNPQTVLPSLALFAVAAVRLMPSANRIFLSVSNIRFGRAGAERLLNDLEEVGPFLKQPELSAPVDKDGWKFDREIQLSGVGYRYTLSDRDSLADITVAIQRGQSVAFVGESGAGKTTLVDLVLGLLKPTRGTIRVDGRDIHDFLPVWQRHIGYIPQVIYLAEDTMRANVTLGLPPEEVDNARVWAALEAAQLADFVRSWPEQLDRLIGEKGVRLSGGQRQRIGIARAFYHNPAILILDEATAALDNETEREIVSMLEGFRGEKTLMTIAHRLTTVQRCDIIFLLNQGRIVAHGSFDELQRTSPDFQRMVQAAARTKPTDNLSSSPE